MTLPVLNANPCSAHGCAKCCYDTEMPLLEEDVTRLVGLGHRREDFSRRSDEDHFLYLRTKEPATPGATERPCFFLVDERCSVYADRPAGCRIYPLVLTDDQRLVRDEDCPHRREFPMDGAAKRRIMKIAGQLRREAHQALHR